MLFNRMRYLLISLFIANFYPGVSQGIDYLNLRDSLLVQACGPNDSAVVYNAIRNLEALDTTQITINLHMYYEDLALRYWLLSADKQYGLMSLEANRKALYHKPESHKALYNLAFQYFHGNDCEKGRYYLMLYKKYVPKKYWDKKQEKIWNAKCNQ